jgi:hypothetical protein
MKLSAIILALWIGIATSGSVNAQASNVDQSALTQLLSRHVNAHGWVDYVGLRRDRPALQTYLTSLRNVNVGRMPSDAARLAFWIDAYNAFTLNDVLEYVDGKTDSVKKVDGFFDKHKHPIAGEFLTLDEIEKQARSFHDPRVHFAINCASASCPKLQAFAFTASNLNQQLNQAAAGFLADPRRGLRLQQTDNTIYLSPIFEWYAGDFTGATSTAGELLSWASAAFSGGNVLKFVEEHSAPDVAAYIRKRQPTVKYMTYDWTLNSQKLHPSS